jgi:hypothetical protein
MNLAAILPSFPQIGFQGRHAGRQARAAALGLPERRTLSRNVIVTLENRPLQLRVVRGWVWITRDGCPEDTVLGAGEVFDQRAGPRVLVQALEETELLLADGRSRILQNA